MAVRIIRAIAIMARFLPEDSLLQGVNPAQQYKRLELENGVISVPISEITVIALLRSTPGMVHSNWTAFSLNLSGALRHRTAPLYLKHKINQGFLQKEPHPQEKYHQKLSYGWG